MFRIKIRPINHPKWKKKQLIIYGREINAEPIKEGYTEQTKPFAKDP